MVRFNISAKFVTAFSLLLAVMAAMSLFAVVKIGEVNDLSAQLRSRWLPAAQSLGDIHAYLSQFRIKQGDHVAMPSERTAKLERNAQAVIDGLIDDYAKVAQSKEQKASLDQLRQQWTAYVDLAKRIEGQALANDPAAKEAFEGEALDGFYNIEDTVLTMIDNDGKAANAVSSQSAKIYLDARNFLIGAAIAGLLVAVMLLVVLMHTVARPLNRMSETVKRLVSGEHDVMVPGTGRSDEIGSLARALERFRDLFAEDHQRAEAEKRRAQDTLVTIEAIGGGLAALAEGNLTHRVPENGSGELGKLHVDYNAAVSELSNVLAKIVDGCTTIKLGTHEIAAAASDLSERSEQQASSLAETARTLAEFTGSVKITADNARQTSGRLSVARETADKVEDIARRAVEAMRSIEGSSREMADIVNVIDGIAFQTNLLALNAGVEAARAGESGKGFAVVANEVRALAQRSADAAKDIKALISTSTEQVGGGVSLVESSGEALRQIVGEVSAVSGLVEEIAEAAEKQATGISEISGMVASMDQFTQQNAAMVEETSAGTRNLSVETESLVDQLSRFRLGRTAGGLGSAPARTVAAPAPVATPRPAAAPAARTSEPAPLPPPVHAVAPAPVFHGNAAVALQDDDWSEF
ncbi:methyl-accepting chemotaxis protein [Novosphingobium cyanobacteriorum]|uniref:Methyl-accepting chemotaxis protein n=1 Tax=Novosphingobium cyanobacteriorum TaxID=3024215 RepID=A0ABT6CDS5_9SPHN|nr:methyl-accepting chemotaxis protein [Novosphingobium cyanobacteriorum]MDF8332075.1 methyl-accepting chemotaxis protein [Novosphingobium cyanobacteriorum]